MMIVCTLWWFARMALFNVVITDKLCFEVAKTLSLFLRTRGKEQ